MILHSVGENFLFVGENFNLVYETKELHIVLFRQMSAHDLRILAANLITVAGVRKRTTKPERPVFLRKKK